jgi:hypothetical protein
VQVNWQQVCQPLNRDGLGIANLERCGCAEEAQMALVSMEEGKPAAPWREVQG